MKKFFASLLAVCVLSTASSLVSAAIVTYDMYIDGSNADLQTLSAGTYTLEVRARVADNDLAPGVAGGLLQSAFDLDDSADAIVWTDLAGGFLGSPNGLWDSEYNSAFDSHFQGTLVENNSKIVAETGAIAPGNFTGKFGSVGAGDWSMVARGTFTYSGAPTTLSLTIANPQADVLVAGLQGSNVGAAVASEVHGDSIVIGVPEPASLVLLSGCVACIALRRRSA